MEGREREEREEEEAVVVGDGVAKKKKKMEGEEANPLRQLLKEVKKGGRTLRWKRRLLQMG